MSEAGADLRSRMEALTRAAEAAAAAGDWPGSIRVREQAVRLAPADPGAWIQLSYALSLSGDYRRAEDATLTAQRLGARDPRVLAELLPRLRTFNAGPALLRTLERAGPRQRMPISLLLVAAAQLSYLNLAGEAIAYLDEARTADPDYPPTLIARTQVLTYLGRFDEARHDAKRALARAPEIAHAHWLLAQLPSDGDASARIDDLRRELRRPARTAADVASLGFALHRLLDDAKDVGGAWEALEQANQAKRSTLRYDARQAQYLLRLLAQDEAPDSHRAGTGPTPVFVVGMHRSGTTLLEQLLAAHPAVRGLGELYDFTGALRHAADHHCRGVVDETIVERLRGANLRAVGRRYLDGVAWRLGGEEMFVDKLPSNFLNVGYILRALPHARILHMRRDPVETCFSNLRELFSEANPYSYDQHELADYYLGYRTLMAHWHTRYPGRILDVDYARLVAGTEAQMRDVASFCGIGFDPAMLSANAAGRGVATASAVQVRGRIAAPDVPKWVPYAEQLAPLRERLGTASTVG